MDARKFRVIAKSGLNIRSGPGISFEDWGDLAPGEVVISPDTSKFAPILLSDGSVGWAALKYLEELSVPEGIPESSEQGMEATIQAPAGEYDFSIVEGTKAAIAAECRKQGLNLPEQIAYVLATVEHESGFKPIRERGPDSYFDRYEGRQDLGNIHPGDGLRFKGRGFVQITGRANYTAYSKITGKNLVEDPDLALDPQIAVFILVHGFRTGTFTGKKITDYIKAGKADFVNARRCINALDRADHIAALAKKHLKEIPPKESGAVEPPPPEPDLPAIPLLLLQDDLPRIFQSPTDRWLSPAWKKWGKQWITWIALSPWADQLRDVRALWSGDRCGFYGNKILQGPIKKVFSLLAARELLQDLETFDGCWNPRPMSSGRRLSVHSWGLALDFNADSNPYGGEVNFSDQFLQTWAECGWECGATWSTPDGMHMQWAWTENLPEEYEPEPLLPTLEGRS